MKLIPLTKGHFAMVDDEDFEWLNRWKWCANVKNGKIYAKRTNKSIAMHRVIMGVTDPNIDVDHEDLTGNNNQRSNLRVATQLQNSSNRAVDRRSKTGFKGVSHSKTMGKYRAYIVKDYKQTTLGYSDCPKTCARTYNEAAKQLHGKFASLNPVEDGPVCTVGDIFPNTNTSGFRGVSQDKKNGKWVMQIVVNKVRFGGSFSTPEESAHAYDKKAIELYGPDYKKLNFTAQPTP
jgi:hypothetical protein